MNGRKTMIFNTQERAVSTDVNRLQAFAGKAQAELFRMMLGISANDDLDAGISALANYEIPTTTSAPLNAEIVNGLLVLPETGTLTLRVTPGVMWAVQPDPVNTDNSAYVFVDDPGIETFAASTLVMTANASGSTRVDVIECKIGSVTIETDNRDIFDPLTGLFVATMVPKVTIGRVTEPVGTNIRVRLGAPGGSVPAPADGWLVLAVASVPDGTTTNDTITFWDVRPLVQDRVFSPYLLDQTYPTTRVRTIAGGLVTATHASVEAVLNGRRLGGLLRTGGPAADVDSIDLTASTNRDQSVYAIPDHSFIYLTTPAGLPRWARYTSLTTPGTQREPRSPRGIPIVSKVRPDARGRPLSALDFHAAIGLGTIAVIEDAVCVSGTFVSDAAGPINLLADGEWHSLFSGTGVTGIVTSGGSPYEGQFTLPVATNAALGSFPQNAKSIRCMASLYFTWNDTTHVRFNLTAYMRRDINGVLYPPTVMTLHTNHVSVYSENTGLERVVSIMFDAPIGFLPDGATPNDLILQVDASAFNSTVNPTMTACSLVVVGWKL